MGQVDEMRVSAEFDDVYLNNLLESLGDAYGFDYQVKGKEVTAMFDQKQAPRFGGRLFLFKKML